MIVTVTLNPAIDRTMIVPDFAIGAVNRVSVVREDMGGKGINVSKVLKGLHHDNVAIGFIGKQNSSLTQALLEKENIVTDFVLVDAPTRTNTKVVDPATHTTTDINESGFTVEQHHIEQLKALIDQYARKCEVMVFSGSICRGIAIDQYAELMTLANQHTKVVLDADREALLQGIKCQPYLIKPNIHELSGITEQPLSTIDDVIMVAQQLIQQHHITYVLVSMGESGSVLINKERALLANPLRVPVKSTVGAGDSMLAGFIHTITTTSDPVQALKTATACGALAVTKEGTQALTADEIEHWINKVVVMSIE